MTDPPTRHSRAEATIRRVAIYLAAGLFGAVTGLAVVLAGVWWSGPGQSPLITEDILADAQATWQRTAPDSYDVEVAVIGRETATYRVEVRGGEIRAASRDGQPLRQQRTWGTWTVPGMFETIARDVAAVEQARSGQLESGTQQLVLRGRFDPQWGFPRRYQRTELRKFGANQEVLWEVTAWQVR